MSRAAYTHFSGSNKQTLRWIWNLTKGTRHYCVVLAFVQVIQALLVVVSALLLKQLIDCAVAGESSLFVCYCVAFGLCLLLGVVLSAITRRWNELSASTYENRFRAHFFRMLLEKDYALVGAIHSGEWMNRFTSDANVVASNITQLVPKLLGLMVRLVAVLIALLVMQPVFAYVLFPGAVVLIAGTLVFRGVLKRYHRAIQEADGHVRAISQEHIESMVVVHAFQQEARAAQTLSAAMRDHQNKRMKRNFVSNVLNSGFSLIVNAVYLLAVVYCGFGILTGTISYGTFLAVIQLVQQVQAPIANLSSIVPSYYAMLASAERIMELEMLNDKAAAPSNGGIDASAGAAAPAGADVSAGSEVSEGDKAPSGADAPAAASSSAGAGAPTATGLPDFLCFGLRDASFSYYRVPELDSVEATKLIKAFAQGTEDTPGFIRYHVLENCNVQVNKGEFVALTGESGCGKSTVLKLLMRLYALDAGTCYVQNALGVECELNGDYVRLFAYVPQGNVLISGTVRQMLSFGDARCEHNDTLLWESLRLACADTFVRALPCGLDTVLGESGAGLSEGQMQRLSIARALVSGRPVLLLDECTSALDGPTEEQILKNLRALPEKTVLVVTHRPAALKVCDRQINFEC